MSYFTKGDFLNNYRQSKTYTKQNIQSYAGVRYNKGTSHQKSNMSTGYISNNFCSQINKMKTCYSRYVYTRCS